MSTIPVEKLGVISDGTLKIEEILEKMLPWLEEYGPAKNKDLIRESRRALAVFEEARNYDDIAKEDRAFILVACLYDAAFDAMEELAPAGYWFGTHPDDPACVGFFPDSMVDF